MSVNDHCNNCGCWPCSCPARPITPEAPTSTAGEVEKRIGALIKYLRGADRGDDAEMLGRTLHMLRMEPDALALIASLTSENALLRKDVSEHEQAWKEVVKEGLMSVDLAGELVMYDGAMTEAPLVLAKIKLAAAKEEAATRLRKEE